MKLKFSIIVITILVVVIAAISIILVSQERLVMDTIFTEIKSMSSSFAMVNQAVVEQAAGGPKCSPL
ncbi:hypothetical protein FACS1894172_17120 [Spirochaetia bacterium]|nr:hypothetical protein FACS1894164_17310 [Spirochaetia bacterium]GHU35378.1 hypothetical protein FACS1894172_17120 [Spirochaetia bacterium]